MIQLVITSIENDIEKIYYPIRVDWCRSTPLKDVCYQAQIRQRVVKLYPDGKYFEAQRVTWVDVPKGYSIEDVENELKKYPNACILRLTSYDINDILSNEQKFSIEKGTRTKEQYQSSLIVLTRDGEHVNSQPTYAQNVFKKEFEEDVDYTKKYSNSRVNDKHERYYNDFGGAHGYDDSTIYNAFEGDPDNYWNID